MFKISGLHVQYAEPSGRTIHAVNGANLEVHRGEVLGVLGESASGKSTIARACLRLLPKSASLTQGKIELDGLDLVPLSEKEMREIRGARISLIPQDAGQSLNPVMKVGDQIAEVLRAHCSLTPKQCLDRAESLLETVQLIQKDRRMYDAYPHQLSGGQQQRITIAQALACDPALVIADEPTASLDPDTAQEILELLRVLKNEKKMSLLLITHDPIILTRLADRVAVVYGGRVIETGVLAELFRSPLHPYTRGLLACLSPTVHVAAQSSSERFPTIPGSAPDPELLPAGCTFAPRCSQRMPLCDSQHPALVVTDASRHVECFLYGA